MRRRAIRRRRRPLRCELRGVVAGLAMRVILSESIRQTQADQIDSSSWKLSECFHALERGSVNFFIGVVVIYREQCRAADRVRL